MFRDHELVYVLHDTLCTLLDDKDWTRQTLVDKSGVRPRTLQHMLGVKKKGKRVATKYCNVKFVAEALGVVPSALVDQQATAKSREHALDVNDSKEMDQQLPSEDEMSLTVGSRLLVGEDTMQDRKNVIRDDSISHRILAATQLPSFAECVHAVRTVYPADEKEKDTPQNPGWRYNHFIQAGALVCIEPEEGEMPLVLAYHRVPQVRLPPERTPGISVLWGASFNYNVRPGGSTMDRWMDQVTTDRNGAQRRLIDPKGSVLAELLRYKIGLVDLPLTLAPFAVITNDQRTDRVGGGWMGRVYTQYVFHVRLSTRELQKSAKPEPGLRAPGIQVFCLPKQEMKTEDLEQRFCNKQTNAPNLMDILAWRGMFEQKNTIRIGKARLVKGFDLVPNHKTRSVD